MKRQTVDDRLLQQIERMTPAQRAAQLFMVAPDPTDDPAAVAEWLADNFYAGLFLQWRHLGDREWVYELAERLTEQTEEGLPYLVATDEEGGLVSDLAGLTSTGPSAAALGIVDDAEVTTAVARAMGAKLRALGFNVLFAPVLDVNSEARNPVIGTRAYGTSEEKVTRHGLAALAGYLQAGVATCAKHFPGHGATRLDSHLTLPAVDSAADTLLKVDLPPFRAAVDAGLPLMMTAHVAYPALDATGAPATLSAEIIGNLLREGLGFNGVVVTDSMEMEGVAQLGDPATVALRAIEAGADLLLYGVDREMAEEAAHGVTEALRNGSLSEERVMQSLLRLGRLKMALRVVNQRNDTLGREETLDYDHEVLLRQASGAAIRIRGHEAPDLPLNWRQRRGLWVLPTGPEPRLLVEDEPLRDLIEPLNMHLSTVSLTPSDSERNGLLRRANEADYIVACTLSRGPLNAEQRRMVDALVTTGKPVILVALLNPADLEDFPSIETRIATYGFGPLVLEGLVKLMTEGKAIG